MFWKNFTNVNFVQIIWFPRYTHSVSRVDSTVASYSDSAEFKFRSCTQAILAEVSRHVAPFP